MIHKSSNYTSTTSIWGGNVPPSRLDDLEAELLQGKQLSKWQCSLCSSIYSSERVMKEHIKAIHLHKMLCHCKDCGQSFKWRHQLQKHRLTCPARLNSDLIEI